MFTASARNADNIAPTSERLLNLIPVPAPQGARASLILRSTPGTRDFSTLSGPFLRAMAVVDGTLYVVSSGGLYRVPESGAAAYLGAVTDDHETSMAGNRGVVTIAAAGNYYTWDGSSLTQPGSGCLTDVRSVEFLNQYTLLSGAPSSGKVRSVEWTEAGLAGSRNALYFREAEIKDDDIVRIVAFGGFLYVFKSTSYEIWAPAGSGTGAFVYTAKRDIGLLGYNLVAVTPGGIFFVGSDRTARFLQGGEATQVSTPPVDDALARSTPSHVFYYEDRGQRLATIRFDDRPAWVNDLSMARWHERSSGVDHKPWDVIAAAFAYGQWILGGRTGRLYKLGLTPVDITGPMRRTAISLPLYAESDRFTINKLEVMGRFGANYLEENAPNWVTSEYGLPFRAEDGSYVLAEDQQPVTKISAPGRIWLRCSRDGGYTWGLPKIKEIGRLGDYEARAVFRALGQYRYFTAELNITDPIDVPLLSEALVT